MLRLFLYCADKPEKWLYGIPITDVRNSHRPPCRELEEDRPDDLAAMECCSREYVEHLHKVIMEVGTGFEPV